MKDDYIAKGRSVIDLKAHLVLTSKYRPKVFSAEMLQPLGEIVADLSQKWDCQLIEFNGEGWLLLMILSKNLALSTKVC
ncbi:MAG: hypothetical protein F6J90_20190 [Moorea sp. SIOASIH]|nr:hypothetical protein [Moorena sp. SIOASIH]